jgi:hypothetical protein
MFSTKIHDNNATKMIDLNLDPNQFNRVQHQYMFLTIRPRNDGTGYKNVLNEVGQVEYRRILSQLALPDKIRAHVEDGQFATAYSHEEEEDGEEMTYCDNLALDFFALDMDIKNPIPWIEKDKRSAIQSKSTIRKVTTSTILLFEVCHSDDDPLRKLFVDRPEVRGWVATRSGGIYTIGQKTVDSLKLLEPFIPKHHG